LVAEASRLELRGPVFGGIARRHSSAVISRVQSQSEANLAQIIGAGDAARRSLGAAQRRQQQGGQNRDDGNYHQQFD